MAEERRRVLALCAHPDDIEFGCAGTLILLREKGYEVTLATMTDGDCGSNELANEEIAAIRLGEAAEAASVIGADYIHVGAHDMGFEFNDHWRRQVIDTVRRVDPCIVFAHPPADYLIDHEIASRLVREATFWAGVPNLHTEHGHTTGGVPHLYYTEPMDGVDVFGNPYPVGFHVDISSAFETKQRMLACHDSQRKWLRAYHGMDHYLVAQQERGKARGREAGVEYAEAFRQHLGHGYPHDNVLADVLGVPEPKAG